MPKPPTTPRRWPDSSVDALGIPTGPVLAIVLAALIIQVWSRPLMFTVL